MTKDEARGWLQQFSELPPEQVQTCQHGHLGCSTELGGECLTDVINAACLVWEGDEVKSQ